MVAYAVTIDRHDGRAAGPLVTMPPKRNINLCSRSKKAAAGDMFPLMAHSAASKMRRDTVFNSRCNNSGYLPGLTIIIPPAK